MVPFSQEWETWQILNIFVLIVVRLLSHKTLDKNRFFSLVDSFFAHSSSVVGILCVSDRLELFAVHGESGGQVFVSNALLRCPFMPDLLHNITLGSPGIPGVRG